MTWCLSRKLGQEPVIASRASFWAQNRIGIERFMSQSEKVAGGKIHKDTDSKSERWNSQPYSEALLQQQSIHSTNINWALQPRYGVLRNALVTKLRCS